MLHLDSVIPAGGQQPVAVCVPCKAGHGCLVDAQGVQCLAKLLGAYARAMQALKAYHTLTVWSLLVDSSQLPLACHARLDTAALWTLRVCSAWAPVLASQNLIRASLLPLATRLCTSQHAWQSVRSARPTAVHARSGMAGPVTSLTCPILRPVYAGTG